MSAYIQLLNNLKQLELTKMIEILPAYMDVNVNIKMIKKWKIKMYICQELFLSLCFHKGPFLFQTV